MRKVSSDGIAELERYSWPGNVRELRNVVERVLLLAPGDVVEAETVRRALPGAAGAAGGFGALGGGTAASRIALEMGTLAQRVEAFERETLLAELKLHHH